MIAVASPWTPRRRAPDSLLPAEAVAEIRAALPGGRRRRRRGDHRGGAQPTTDAFTGPMGETIRNAVQVALGGVPLPGHRPARRRPAHARRARGRGRLPARAAARRAAAARPTPCSSAYRIGARVSWRAMSTRGGRRRARRRDPGRASPSWSSPTSTSSPPPASPGTPTSSATTGRVRQRRLERLAHHLLTGSPRPTVRRRRRAGRLAAAHDADRA